MVKPKPLRLLWRMPQLKHRMLVINMHSGRPWTELRRRYLNKHEQLFVLMYANACMGRSEKGRVGRRDNKSRLLLLLLLFLTFSVLVANPKQKKKSGSIPRPPPPNPPQCSFRGKNKNKNHATHLQELRRSRSVSRPYKDIFGSSTRH